jgi:hypothetical protein
VIGGRCKRKKGPRTRIDEDSRRRSIKYGFLKSIKWILKLRRRLQSVFGRYKKEEPIDSAFSSLESMLHPISHCNSITDETLWSAAVRLF